MNSPSYFAIGVVVLGLASFGGFWIGWNLDVFFKWAKARFIAMRRK